MAIRALNSVIVANYDTLATASWQAGVCLAINSSTGNVQLATRASGADTANFATFVGFSSDDTARSGNTMILADPVGSNYIDGSGNFQSNNNGFYVAAKRAIGDFQSEIVNGVTNLSAQSSGYEGPRRGVGVYNTPGGQFVTDQFSLVTSSGVNADSGGTWTPAPGDACTFAADGTGKLVKLATIGTDGPMVARVDKYDSAAGLLYITMVLQVS
jgi:hypothetical protein